MMECTLHIAPVQYDLTPETRFLRYIVI
jgi:hypothetical protein